MRPTRRRFLQQMFGIGTGVALGDEILEVLDRLAPRPPMVKGVDLVYECDVWLETACHATDAVMEWLSPQFTPAMMYDGVSLEAVKAQLPPMPLEVIVAERELLDGMAQRAILGSVLPIKMQVERTYKMNVLRLDALGASIGQTPTVVT